MAKIRLLFAAFSLIAVSGVAGAQQGERDKGNERDHHESQAGRGDRDNVENEMEGENDNEDENDNGNRSAGIWCTDRDGTPVLCNGANRSGLPQMLPDMVSAILNPRGQLSPEAARWLGTTRLTPRFVAAGQEPPKSVTWVNQRGQTAEVWTDTNGDGRADIVQFYRGGHVVRTIRK